MNKSIIYLFLLIISLGNCGVHIQKTQLTDEWGGTYANSAVKEFQEKEIYNDLTVDVWGMEKTDCKNFTRLDSISYTGKSCISVSWNRTGNCPWIGFGIGWNGYAAKDLTDVMNNGSIDFYIRAIKGKQFIPTLIFLLEDYSGVQSATVLKASQLSHYPIDEEWQKVSIPLQTFLKSAKPLCDFSNIKSLNVECQGAGAFLIDKIEIGGANTKNMSNKKFGVAITQNFPATIFHDELPFAWGLGNYSGKNISIDSTKNYTGNKSIYIKWNEKESGNQMRKFGMNWENWQAISFPDSLKNYLIKFYVSSNDLNSCKNINIGFESYNGKTAMIPIKHEYIIGLSNNKNWQMVTIPFTEFDFTKEGFDITRFKQLIIEYNNSGELWLDEMTIEQNKNYE
jgi:hypothetical protein